MPRNACHSGAFFVIVLEISKVNAMDCPGLILLLLIKKWVSYKCITTEPLAKLMDFVLGT